MRTVRPWHHIAIQRHPKSSKDQRVIFYFPRYSAIAEEFLEKLRREECAPATLSKIEWMLGLVLWRYGKKPIREITASQILEALRTIERRGRHETARRTRSTIGAIFRYTVATTRADNDPTFALRGALTAPKVNHRSAIIDPVKFGGLLLGVIESFDGQPTTKAALQLIVAWMQRVEQLPGYEKTYPPHWRQASPDRRTCQQNQHRPAHYAPF